MNVETVDIHDIHADPANCRRHPERNKATIRASLTRFGPGRSIVLDRNNVVRAGNGTLEAALANGLDEVLIVEPKANQLVAVRRPEWSDTEATGYSIGDNRSSDLAEDDNVALAEQLDVLRNAAPDILPALGYDAGEIDAMIERLAGEIVADPQAEWEGMPEFQHEDQTSQFQATVHFANEMGMRSFEELVGQKIPTNTRAIWYPKQERQVVRGNGYVSNEP